jgi:hypothetical protein
MLTFSNEFIDWMAERTPDAPKSTEGGRPAADNRGTLRGIFWIRDSGFRW